jgi:hypothetical protein
VDDIVFSVLKHMEASDDSWREDCEYSGAEPGYFAEVLYGEAGIQGGDLIRDLHCGQR